MGLAVALALCTVLGAGGDTASDAPLTGETVAPSTATPAPEEAELFEADPEEDARIVRIGVTLAGGAIGISLPLLIGWGIQAGARPCPMVGTCSEAIPLQLSSFVVPLTLGAGLTIPHQLLKGRGGMGFGLIGALAGYITANSMLAFFSLASRTDWAVRYPAAGAGLLTAFALVGGVASLELRHRALNSGAVEWSIGRLFAVGAAFWLPLGAVEAGLVGLAIAFRDGGVATALLSVGSVLNLTGAMLLGWGVHRAMGGHGTVWASLIGLLVSMTVAGTVLGAHSYAPPAGGVFGGVGTGSSVGSLSAMIAVSTGVTATGPSVALEWSSAVTSPDPDPAPLEDLQLGLGPAPGGGMVSFSGRF